MRGLNYQTYAQWLKVFQGAQVNGTKRFEISINSTAGRQLYLSTAQPLQIKFSIKSNETFGPRPLAINNTAVSAGLQEMGPLIGFGADYSRLTDFGPQIGSGFGSAEDHSAGPKEFNGPHQVEFNSAGLQEEFNSAGLQEEIISPKEVFYSNRPHQLEITSAGLHEEDNFGPPPGFGPSSTDNHRTFAGELLKGGMEGASRRSPRLSEKNKGPYIAAVDKARPLKEKQHTATPSKANQPSKQFKGPDLTYM
ncbi:hypothetical protein FCM35_KLT00457 [Carex littledalei]|uniref:Uncharacterized protein n=1 Tax=Carex littledalei TaxID=544730 RepID=A0A833W3B0_9POAL|nr:hypothetical protein FCM35_KLT00457 [Carex littledalei]